MAILEQERVLEQKSNADVLTRKKLWAGRGQMCALSVQREAQEHTYRHQRGAVLWISLSWWFAVPLCAEPVHVALSESIGAISKVFFDGHAGKKGRWAVVTWITWTLHSSKEGWSAPSLPTFVFSFWRVFWAWEYFFYMIAKVLWHSNPRWDTHVLTGFVAIRNKSALQKEQEENNLLFL